MLLPTPPLDDRRFQQIVDEAKTLIPKYCPEWTDHNVSDPGVALIELFAWMMDMLLYRVNQVPDRMYIKFLEMIGMELESTRAAQAPVTFYLSAPQPGDVTIPVGTEVATARTETNPAIIFTTEEEQTIRPPILSGAFTHNNSRIRDADGGWTIHDLRALPDQAIPIFPPHPSREDSFCLAFEKDHSHHVLALVVDCETAGGAGVDPENPPLVWEVSQAQPGVWTPCEIESDGTRGFNEAGENTLVLHLPEMKRREQAGLPGVNAYWLRCRLTEAQTREENKYKETPRLRQVRAESWGVTVSTRHAVTVNNEALGHSDGTPGQTFHLLNTPVLDLDDGEYLVIETPEGRQERWEPRSDFADSKENDKHFVLDKLSGTITLGPTLLQPDGRVYSFGAVPPRDSALRFSRYRHGGGVAGNASKGAISVLKSSLSYVSHVMNRRDAQGGLNAQTLEDAKLRAPQFLRTRTRAVTADDHEYLARRVPGVARARCLAPGAQTGEGGGPDDIKPGQVIVYVLPQTDAPEGYIPEERLILGMNVRNAVLAELEGRRLLGITLDVRAPQYVRVLVDAQLRLPEHSDPGLIAETRQRAEAALYRYLNPYIGGPPRQGEMGWPFGRDLHKSEIYGLLQQVPSVEFVESLSLFQIEPGGRTKIDTRLRVPRHALICSDTHTVTVSPSS